MKITKTKLKQIVKEELAVETALLNEQEDSLQSYRVTMVVAVPPGQEDYILQSIEQGMEFNEAAGEGILEYNIQPEG